METRNSEGDEVAKWLSPVCVVGGVLLLVAIWPIKDGGIILALIAVVLIFFGIYGKCAEKLRKI